MEVTVKGPVSLFFVHCPFICWFSLAHSVSFTEVPNLTRKEWQKAENQKNVKSTNLSPWRSPRRTHGGQVTNRGVIAKKITTTPKKKKWHLRACSRGEKVTSNGSQELGAGTLLNQLFPCRKLQDEVIEHGLTILADLGLPPFEETSMCHENLWCFNWVSSYPRGQIRPPKRWAWSHTHLWSPCFPCASGKRWSQPSWWKRVQHPRFLGPSSKIQPRTPDDFVYLLQDVARTHQSWVLRKFESKGYA